MRYYTHAERLSALDSSFLDLEDHDTHMHIAGVAVFDAAPLRTPTGGIDVERIRHLVETSLPRIPRYRQRLARIPVLGQPVWVDDPRFNLHYHLRHTHLPLPGDNRQLKRLVGRLVSQQLDRGKPLWEMWVVEGLDDDRFAIVTKAHHCMIDGVGSVQLAASLIRSDAAPVPRLDEPPPRWLPRPAPRPHELLAGELWRRLREPLAALGTVASAMRAPRATAAGVRETVGGVWEAISSGLRPASPTPLNVPIGPHRRFDWLDMDLAAVRAVKARLGGTVNDVVLAVLAGALRRFLRRRSVAVEGLDFRAMLPVNVRGDGDHEVGNRVVMLTARLPLDERDPRRRLERVVAETRARKGSRQAAGLRTIEELGDRTFASLFTEFARLAARSRPFNLVVTNVPGPPFPVYVLGARMRACYPLVPLYQGQALGVALFSYDGRLFWGFNADWDALPDLHDLVEAVGDELGELVRAASPEGTAATNGGAAVVQSLP